MNHRKKISSEQRHELLQIYLHLGLEASRTACVEYGVNRDYAAKYASELGINRGKRI